MRQGLDPVTEEVVVYRFSNLVKTALQTEDPKLVRQVRAYWDGESLESIRSKFQTEGSTWCVWFYDGVAAYIADQNRRVRRKSSNRRKI